jgi:hypothetical protein
MLPDNEFKDTPKEQSTQNAPPVQQSEAAGKPFTKDGQTWVDEVCYSGWFEGKHMTW